MSGLRSEDRPGGVRILTLSNPKKRNALDEARLGELERALNPSQAADVRVLVLRGEGDHFCSGYDLSGLEELPQSGPLPDEPLQSALAALEAHPAVTIAMVRGAAFGGGAELALATDFRLFGDDAIWSLPPAKIGVVYAPQGLERVIRQVGPARAKLLFFAAKRVRPADALAWGLCEEVHPASELEERTLALAQEIAGHAPLALSGMKRAFQLLARGPLTPEDAEAVRRLRREAFSSEDAQEGRRALLEKRAPQFRGR